jgi:paraquat-inducible protein B
MNRFILAADEPVNKTRNTGLNLVLEASRLGAIKAGVKIYYRQIAIGEVLGVKLGQRADRVQMFINIAPAYQNLIRDNSVFWNASGIQLQAGLFSGVDLRTESLESILSGGIAVATPDTPGTPVGQGTTFELNSELDDDWLDWSPQIELSQ